MSIEEVHILPEMIPLKEQEPASCDPVFQRIETYLTHVDQGTAFDEESDLLMDEIVEDLINIVNQNITNEDRKEE